MALHPAGIALAAALAIGLAPTVSAAPDVPAEGKVPITTQSKEALAAYLEGRDLIERLRVTDARAALERAVAADPNFALAHLALANSAPSTKEFFDSLQRAVALAEKVSVPERHMILGLNAGIRSDPDGQREHYRQLVAAYPNDERAHNLLGAHYFGRQEWAVAIEEYKKATAINPSFSQPYNQMGYGYRFLGKYDDAEQAFKKYIELIPGDPNPYDSYAELLMKMGRFPESIQNYEKALAANKNFVASYVGIGLNQMLMGQPDKARETYARLTAIARNTGERRQALIQTAASHVDQASYDKAIQTVETAAAISEGEGDLATLPGDHILIANILIEAGRADDALARLKKAAEVSARSNAPAEVKAAVGRNILLNEARAALAKKDVATAKAKAADHARQVAVNKVPFEVWQTHEIAGLIALEAKDYGNAVAELSKANQQDPRVLYHLARAHQGKGDAATARSFFERAADFNGLGFTYSYVRGKARKELTPK